MNQTDSSLEVSIIVTGIHLDHRTEPKRLWEIKDIRKALDTIFEEDRCQIWTGDFNALTIDDYTQDELKEIAKIREQNSWEAPKSELTKKIANEYGFVDTRCCVESCLPIKTCRFGTRIDYIFASPQLMGKFDVVEVIHDTDTTSDHQMVVAKFVPKQKSEF